MAKMRALVKSKDRDLRHRHPHLQLGRVGPEDHPRPHARRPRVRGRDRRGRQSHVRGFNEGDRVSGEGHITCGHCRNCRAGKRHLCRNTVGVGVNRPGCVRRVPGHPRPSTRSSCPHHPRRRRGVLRPLGNAAHTALSFDWSARTCSSPARARSAHGRRHRRHVGARHVVITDVNDYRLELAKKMGATRAVNVKTSQPPRT
jgi:threonine 3-dehydrogenase